MNVKAQAAQDAFDAAWVALEKSMAAFAKARLISDRAARSASMQLSAAREKFGVASAALESAKRQDAPEFRAAAKALAQEKSDERDRLAALRDAEMVRATIRASAMQADALAFGMSASAARACAFYAQSGDMRGACAEYASQAVRHIADLAESGQMSGFALEKLSISEGVSAYLRAADGRIVRVSDHYLPMTAAREHNHAQGKVGIWSAEVIVSAALKHVEDVMSLIFEAMA